MLTNCDNFGITLNDFLSSTNDRFTGVQNPEFPGIIPSHFLFFGPLTMV